MLLSAKRRAYFCKSIAIEMEGVLRYFSKVLGSGVDLTLLNFLHEFPLSSTPVVQSFWAWSYVPCLPCQNLRASTGSEVGQRAANGGSDPSW